MQCFQKKKRGDGDMDDVRFIFFSEMFLSQIYVKIFAHHRSSFLFPHGAILF